MGGLTSGAGPASAESPEFACEEVASDSGGPLLIAIHGMLSSTRQWLRNKQALASVTRPVLLDLWGHGDSPVPEATEHYTVDGLIQAIDRVRSRYQASQVVLCTQSFGAGLGLHYCARFPERVIAHIFTNSMSALSRPAQFDASRNRQARIDMIREQGQAGLAKMPFHPSNARRLDPEVREILVDAANRVDPNAFTGLTGQTRPHLSAIDLLAGIQVPTLLVNGRWEKGFQPLRDEAVQLLPGLQVVDIDAGHAVNLEQAEAFNQAALEFLKPVLNARQ